ncbi:hypothetical protein L3Y34_006916 [Caenorhabditis briggsae]|nr:hypothetical protein L3Y34_006916 [Caenorhabditis briggsae]
MSCRACGAFFRRSANQNFKARDKTCEKGDCEIFKDGKFQCKVCRLKKCYQVGMDSGKFQSDRDLISNSNNYLARGKVSPPQSLASFVGRPEFILCCEPDKMSYVKTMIDVSDLIYKASSYLQEDPILIPYKYENSLEKMTLAMEDMKIRRANKPVQFVKTIGKAESLIFFETNFIAAAQWFSGFPEFTSLDMDVKLEILKSSWLLWLRLEKLAETADYHRRHVLGSDVFMCSEGACLNVETFELDLKWCTNYSVEQLRNFLIPVIEDHWRQSVAILTELDPSNIELNFMLIQLCLHEAGKKFQGKILDATDKLMQIQANNLHDYYTKKLKLPNYSSRLTKLMKVNQAIAADARKRKEKAYLAEIFNLFTVEYSHPEMFEIA